LFLLKEQIDISFLVCYNGNMIKLLVEDVENKLRKNLAIVDTKTKLVFFMRQGYNCDWYINVEYLQVVDSNIAKIEISKQENPLLYDAFKKLFISLKDEEKTKNIKTYGQGYEDLFYKNSLIFCNQEKINNTRNKTCFLINENCVKIITQTFSRLDMEVSINTDRGPYIEILRNINNFWINLQNLPGAKLTKNLIQTAVELTKNEKDMAPDCTACR